MAKSGEYGGRDTNAPISGHLFLDMPSSVALGIVEMRMQLATADIFQLLSMPVNQ
jgi:hypothetical protein